MKVLIAIVMFLFGLFVGILAMPMFKELSSSMSVEEEYSMPRIKTLLSGFGITLPLEATDINIFSKQDGLKKQLWVKFECPSEVRDAFVEELTQKFSGLFNQEIESPAMFDGTPIAWWSYRTSFRYYEFNGMCAAYDELMRVFYLYAVSDGNEPAEQPSSDLD